MRVKDDDDLRGGKFLQKSFRLTNRIGDLLMGCVAARVIVRFLKCIQRKVQAVDLANLSVGGSDPKRSTTYKQFIVYIGKGEPVVKETTKLHLVPVPGEGQQQNGWIISEWNAFFGQ
jgi:hypothetical protein